MDNHSTIFKQQLHTFIHSFWKCA